MVNREPTDRPTPPSDGPITADSPLDMNRLVSDHLNTVYGYALRLSGSTHEAEEITQQAFLLAQSRRDQIRQPDRVRGWLLTVTRNCFLKNRRLRNPSAATDNGLQLDQVEDPLPAADQIDVERLQMALDQLDEPFRVVLVMYYYEQASYRDISEALQIPPGTVMSRLARAKLHLRRHLLRGNYAVAGLDAASRKGP